MRPFRGFGWLPSVALVGLLAGLAPLGSDAQSAHDEEKDAMSKEQTIEKSDKEMPGKDAAASDSAVSEIDAFIAKQSIDKSKAGWKQSLPKPPQVSFAGERRYLWDLQTSHGPLVIQLMPDVAPMHVSSTIYLTRLGFYDDAPFHRVIPSFMAQGGDPTGTGRGGPGYSYGGEFKPGVKHDKPGLLSMANTGAPNTDGSQFFLTFTPTPWLDGKHTIFGELVGGQNTLKKLESLGSQGGQPKERIVIERASIRVE